MSKAITNEIRLARGRRNRVIGEHVKAYAFLAPAMIIFFLFLLWPIIKALRMSFYDYSGIGALDKFVGIQNYADAFSDEIFLESVVTTLKLVVYDLIFTLSIGFLLAYMLYRRAVGWQFFSVALYIPAVVPITVASLIWRQIYETTQGLLNTTLGMVGLEALQQAWLGTYDTAFGSAVVAWVWRAVPFAMLILYSSMLKISSDLLEAARLDGANEFHIICHIILPQLIPVLSVLTVNTIAGDFRGFDMIFVLTGGGPGTTTQLTTLYIYKMAQKFFRYGYANALGIIVLAIVLILLGIFFGVGALTRRIKEEQLKRYETK